MLNSGKKIRASLDKKNKYSNSKNILNVTKNNAPPPLQVKWSVPNPTLKFVFLATFHVYNNRI